MPTTASLPRRLLLCLLAIATLATAAFATTASAAATVAPFNPKPETGSGSADPQPCTGVPGSLTYTTTMHGRQVVDADGGIHIVATVTNDIREDWIDGTYLIGQIVGPETFDRTAAGTETSSGESRFQGTLYSAAGQVLGYLTVDAEFHYTFVDGAFVSVTSHLKIVGSPC